MTPENKQSAEHQKYQVCKIQKTCRGLVVELELISVKSRPLWSYKAYQSEKVKKLVSWGYVKPALLQDYKKLIYHSTVQNQSDNKT